MTSFPEYLIRALLLAACLYSVGMASIRWQSRFLPDWDGVDALLARITAGLATITVVSYITGSVGLFGLPGLALLLATGPIARRAWAVDMGGSENRTRRPLPPTWTLGVLAACLTVLLSTWLIPIRQAFHTGMSGTDTLWYHLPNALRFHQTGSLLKINYNEPLFETYFYPLLGSVFHAVGMAFTARDFLSPLLNLGFLLGSLLAAASIGRRMNVAVAATLGAAAVFGTDAITGGSPGGAMVDTPSAFFMLAAVALMLRANGQRAALFASGLALGMGLATKLTLAIPATAMLVGVPLIAGSGRRWRTLATFGGGIALTAGFWFLRDLLATGNPLPLVHIPLLPQPLHTGAELESMRSLAGFLGNGKVMLHALPSAWLDRLGPLWPLMMIGSLAGGVAVTVAPPSREHARAWRLAGVVSIAALIGYFFTPGTAAGPHGGPMKGLFWDTRFLAPAIALGLALLPCAAVRWLGRRRDLAVPLLGLVGVITALKSHNWRIRLAEGDGDVLLPPSMHPSPESVLTNPTGAIILAILIVGAGFGIWLLALRLKGRDRIAGAVAGLVIAIGCGWLVGVDYTHARNWGYYAQTPAPGKLKIGIVGTASVFNQYLMSGTGLENHIVFIGVHGPHGSFRSVSDCTGIRRLINRGNFDYVVVAPDRDLWRGLTLHNPLIDWLRDYPGMRKVRFLPGLPRNHSAKDLRKQDRFVLYKVTGKLRSWRCKLDTGKRRVAATIGG